ncbi:hypothetical protein ML437_04025 [Staphylococcus roterodami]|nr:hypothetical protein ML437_04025 [Staphylococcus roterodami]
MSKRNESINLKFAEMIVIKRNHQDASRRKEQNIIIDLKFNAISKSKYIDMNMENHNEQIKLQ